jgi:hypothetical protein
MRTLKYSRRRLALKTLICCNAIILAMLLSVSSHLHAQVFPRGNGISLENRHQFDLYVQIGDWKDMAQDTSEFRLNTLRQFESGLKAADISRRTASRDYLVCNVQAVRNGSRVAYTTAVEYWGLQSTGLHGLLWQHSGIHLVAANRFNERVVAGECTENFLAEWQRWNSADT